MPLRPFVTNILFAVFLFTVPFLNAQTSFTRHTINNNLRGAYWVFAHDIDKDGDIDLATAAFDGLDWWENNGRGSFSRHGVGSLKSAWSVFAAQLSGDSKIDIVGGSTADKEIVLFQNSGGSFKRNVVESNFQDPESVVAADFDGDGDNDLLSCAVNDGVVAWRENRGGNFVKHHIDNLSRAHAVFAADLNRDGKVDAIASGSSDLRWYRNDGSGNFSRRTVGSKGAWGIYAGDVDGDGDLDILRTQRDNGDVDWFENSGSGSFSEHNIQTDYGESWSVVTGDVDGDGDNDVAAAGFAANTIRVWFNNGRGSFDKGTDIDQVNTARGVWIADLDRDGDGDIAAAIREDRDLVWYEANGKATAPGTLTLTGPDGGETLVVGSPFDIQWNSSGSIDAVQIEFSSDNGNSWSVVKASTSNDGRYGWTVPDVISDICLIRISDAAGGNPSDVSNSVFEIIGTPGGGGSAAPTILVFDPESGTVGTRVTIAGTNLNDIASVTFDGTTAGFSIVSAQEISTNVPAGATSGKIVVSGPSGAAQSDKDFVVVPPASGAGDPFLPVQDARVKNGAPNTNYGDRTTLRVDQGSFQTYIKFDVRGLSGAVSRAFIRFFVLNGGDKGGSIHEVSNNLKGSSTPWNENEITFNNAPDIDSPALSSLGPVVEGEFVDFDVTAAMRGNGVYSFGMQTASTNRVDYWSKEGDFPPQLFVETRDGSGDDPKPRFALTITTTGSGRVDSDPAGSAYDEGTEVTLTATPDSGFVFVRWEGDVSGSNPAVHITMWADRQVHALFESKQGDGGGSGDLAFSPAHDAYVKSSRPGSNYGDADVLRIRQGATDYYSYLKFELTGIATPVKKAVLRLFVTDDSNFGGRLYSVSNTFRSSSQPWTETELTWENAPELTGSELSRAGQVLLDHYVDFDVTAGVSGNGPVSFGMNSTSSNSAKYSSREGLHAPQLLITLGDGGGNLPPVARNDIESTESGSPVVIGLAQNDEDPDGALVLGSVVITSQPSRGSVALNPTSGSATYSPNADFVGTDEFRYTIKDNSGATSNVATVSVEVKAGDAGGGGRITVTPIHDAQVKLSAPGSNYGSKSTTKVEAGSFVTYLKFSPSGISGSVQSAILHLYSVEQSEEGGTIFSASNQFANSGNSWTENALNAGNAPAPGNNALASIGPVSSGHFVHLDVTNAVVGNGDVSFAIASSSTDRAKYHTKEGDNPPRLEITFTGLNAAIALTQSMEQPATFADEPEVQLPKTVELLPNFPNPFNAETTIAYGVPEFSEVKLIIYNLLGQRVRTLVSGSEGPGFKTIRWDGKNEHGADVGSGLYFVRLEIGQTRLTRQVALQK